MEGLITKHELDKYIESNAITSDNERNFLEVFEQLTQTRIKSDFHFIDKRGATIFIVSRLNDKKLYIRKHFDAQLMPLPELYKTIPIDPSAVTFFTEWRPGTYTWVYKITKMFYEKNFSVFQIPIYDFVNDKMGYHAEHKGFVTQHAVTSVEMELENASDLIINIQMDKYGNGRLLREEITTKYKLNLSTLNIIESDISSKSYSLK